MLSNENKEMERFLRNLDPKEENGMLNDNSERIERFLRDQMSEEENAAFVSDLRSDPALREQAQIMALLIKGMKEERKEQERVVVDRAPVVAAAACASPAQPVRAADNRGKGFTKLLFWVCAMAAVFVLVFHFVNLPDSYEASPVVAQQKAKLDPKPQKQVADNGNRGKLEQNPTETMKENEQGEETTTEGGKLPAIEIEAGAQMKNEIAKQLAELDQKLENDKDLELVIFELRNILDNIQSHKEYYAMYAPYEQKIKRMLYDAYIKTNDLNLALEMKESLNDTEWAINQDDK